MVIKASEIYTWTDDNQAALNSIVELVDKRLKMEKGKIPKKIAIKLINKKSTLFPFVTSDVLKKAKALYLKAGWKNVEFECDYHGDDYILSGYISA